MKFKLLKSAYKFFWILRTNRLKKFNNFTSLYYTLLGHSKLNTTTEQAMYLTKYFKLFFQTEWLSYFFDHLKFFKNTTPDFYKFLLNRFIIYDITRVDKLARMLYFWKYVTLTGMKFHFPFNSRNHFIYEKIFEKTFLFLTPGILLKLFNISKKSTRQHKRVFKLAMLILKKIIFVKKKELLIFKFKTYHRNMLLFMSNIREHLVNKNQIYCTQFCFKKYNHYIYFRKKRSIKKKIQKRLALLR